MQRSCHQQSEEQKLRRQEEDLFPLNAPPPLVAPLFSQSRPRSTVKVSENKTKNNTFATCTFFSTVLHNKLRCVSAGAPPPVLAPPPVWTFAMECFLILRLKPSFWAGGGGGGFTGASHVQVVGPGSAAHAAAGPAARPGVHQRQRLHFVRGRRRRRQLLVLLRVVGEVEGLRVGV